jgi:hypothetical protein
MNTGWNLAPGTRVTVHGRHRGTGTILGTSSPGELPLVTGDQDHGMRLRPGYWVQLDNDPGPVIALPEEIKPA